jgi:hypothetical protein
MIDLDTFKERNRVSKNKYIEDWIKDDLIPGVRRGPSIEDTQFPNSARRPYRYRARIKQDANNIRAHIVNACVRREHITKEMCHMTQDEFVSQIDTLVNHGLVLIRIEDGITYYDSTAQCDTVAGKTIREIRKFVLDVIEAASRGYAEGMFN